MENSALASARAKIRWAEARYEAINAGLKLTLGSVPETEATNVEVGREGHHFISKFGKVNPVDPSLPLLVGDCVHNLRSALDHLVFQLAILKGSSKSAADKTMFPICLAKSGPQGFDGRVRISLKSFISSAALAEIEKCQPYNAYAVANEADIWILHRLDIIDKHRLLLVARDQFAVKQFWFSAEGGPVNEHVVIPEPNWKPMENGAEIIRFRLSGDSPRKVKVDVKIEATRMVQFINTGLVCDGMPVATVLHQLCGIANAIIRDFGKKFFGE